MDLRLTRDQQALLESCSPVYGKLWDFIQDKGKQANLPESSREIHFCVAYTYYAYIKKDSESRGNSSGTQLETLNTDDYRAQITKHYDNETFYSQAWEFAENLVRKEADAVQSNIYKAWVERNEQMLDVHSEKFAEIVTKAVEPRNDDTPSWKYNVRYIFVDPFHYLVKLWIAGIMAVAIAFFIGVLSPTAFGVLKGIVTKAFFG